VGEAARAAITDLDGDQYAMPAEATSFVQLATLDQAGRKPEFQWAAAITGENIGYEPGRDYGIARRHPTRRGLAARIKP
jgi:hypothetical protein